MIRLGMESGLHSEGLQTLCNQQSLEKMATKRHKGRYHEGLRQHPSHKYQEYVKETFHVMCR